MLYITLKSIRARSVRFVLTGLAIMLSVGLMMGTFVLTETVEKIIDGLLEEKNEEIDVIVQAPSLDPENSASSRALLSEDLVTQVQEITGVASAEGVVFGVSKILDAQGNVINESPWPFFPVVSWPAADELRPFVLGKGRAPQAGREFVLDRKTAHEQGFTPGDTVELLIDEKPVPFELVGVIDLGEEAELAENSLVSFHLRTTQKLLGKPGQVNLIRVAAENSISQAQLARQLRRSLPAELEIITGAEEISRQQARLHEQLRVFTTSLLAFAGIALFVGAFMIHNTFSIMIAQRSRELALLRTLGATPRQILSSVLLESGTVALLSSVAGIFFGIFVAIGLQKLFSLFGVSLPKGPLVIRPASLAISCCTGILVTLISVLAPARKGAKVPPLHALRATTNTTTTSFRTRNRSGLLFGAGGSGFLLWGLLSRTGESTEKIIMVLVGAGCIFLTLILLSPRFAPPLARFVGAPIARIFRINGEIARSNVLRAPHRTAGTIIALMIALALVTTVSVLLQSIKNTIAETLTQAITANYVVSDERLTSTMNPNIARTLAGLSGVDAAIPLRARPGGTHWRLKKETQTLVGVQPNGLDRVLDLRVKKGRIADLADGGVAISAAEAKKRSWSVGEQIPMEFSTTGIQQIRVEAIFSSKGVRDLLGDYLLSLVDYERHIINQTDIMLLLALSDEIAVRAIENTLAAYPSLQLFTPDTLTDNLQAQADELLALVSTLLGLAVFISLLGVANTLVLSTLERTREIALLRAVGMNRKQLRISILAESLIITLMGTMLGILAGMGLGSAISKAATELSATGIPLQTISLFAFFIAAAGTAAAIFPARHAAQLDILTVLGQE